MTKQQKQCSEEEGHNWQAPEKEELEYNEGILIDGQVDRRVYCTKCGLVGTETYIYSCTIDDLGVSTA